MCIRDRFVAVVANGRWFGSMQSHMVTPSPVFDSDFVTSRRPTAENTPGVREALDHSVCCLMLQQLDRALQHIAIRALFDAEVQQARSDSWGGNAGGSPHVCVGAVGVVWVWRRCRTCSTWRAPGVRPLAKMTGSSRVFDSDFDP